MARLINKKFTDVPMYGRYKLRSTQKGFYIKRSKNPVFKEGKKTITTYPHTIVLVEASDVL